jgi:hypothetical protein
METPGWVQVLPEWTPLAIGVLAILTAVVLTVLEHLGIIDLGDYEQKEETCKFCGETPVCEWCGRCFDPRCNAGCIWCRTPPREETCRCCGQTIRR